MSAADQAKWEARWRARAGEPGAVEPFLMREASSWSSGRVLDVASGDGRNALWLATQGFAVTAIDISASAVATLQSTAAARAVAIATRVVDLDMPRPLTGLGPFDAAVVLRYRPSAPQWAAIIATLAPGGQVLLCSFGWAQHERHGFPLAFCVERHAMQAELGTLLQLERWTSFEQGADFLEGSVWSKPSS